MADVLTLVYLAVIVLLALIVLFFIFEKSFNVLSIKFALRRFHALVGRENFADADLLLLKKIEPKFMLFCSEMDEKVHRNVFKSFFDAKTVMSKHYAGVAKELGKRKEYAFHMSAAVRFAAIAERYA